jgi:hypothetical protein
MGIREITHQLNATAPLSLMERERVEERERERGHIRGRGNP